MKKNNLAIVGIFYDGYTDSWVDFLRYFNKFWAKCPYKLYIVSNEKSLPEYSNVNWLHAGKEAEYSRKVQKAIQEIEEDYLLLMLEDFYFSVDLPSDILVPIMEYIHERNLNYYCLSSMSSFTEYKSSLFDDKLPYLYTVNPKRRYTLGCQAAIWEKKFLEKCIGRSNYNAWVFEGAMARSKKTHTQKFLDKCVHDTRNILELKHGILQQKLLPPTVQYFRIIGNPLTSAREVMSEREYKRYVRHAKLSALFPKFIREMGKKMIGKKDSNAVLDKYNQEIEIIIKENFGE